MNLHQLTLLLPFEEATLFKWRLYLKPLMSSILQLSPQTAWKTGVVYTNLEVWTISLLCCQCKSGILLRCGLFTKMLVLCVH